MSSIRNFDNTFNPLQWKGFRALQFTKEEDSFQQLVGDAFKEQFHNRAFISSTLGRDGSIDAWVDSVAETNGRFADFAFPLIVECKHHDAASGNLRTNIAQGWTKVKEKLADKAANGWPGNYSPWQQAQGYIYCISARFSSADEKNKLQESIRNFFADMPEHQRPPLQREQIHVWDWNDLAHWLRESGRLADDWLGIGFDELEDHGAYRERIGRVGSGFHAYLLAEKLPFIAPEIHDPFHPDNLFKRLANGESLVLVGEGGVGKTRTVFEVAEHAQRNGWRVLHLRPSEEGVDLPALAGELLRHPGQTLVTADYIDQFRDFDARYWMHTLLPGAERRSVQLVLLANARPLAASQILRHLTEQKLFSVVDMKPSPIQREQVTRQIEAVICPRAMQTLGVARVRELCGPRPIIAMFIARELERLAEEDNLAHDVLPRPGDLSGWILKRLREDIPQPNVPASDWEPALPPPILCAATAVLAACPMTEGELIGVVMATLQVIPNATHIQAPHIIATLRRGGWLEEDGYLLRTPHDAVADEILQDTLTKYPDILPALFAGARLGRPLGRFAASLGRLAGLGDTCTPILSGAAQWLKQEATVLSEGLNRAEPDATAYAWGAVFDCPPLSNAALEAWPQLITPWLKSHARHPAARHLLYRGLKQLPEQEAHRLRSAAFDWLNGNLLAMETGFVLGPLLAWSPAALDDRETELLRLVMGWLRAHPTELNAKFVLLPLLDKWPQERLGKEESELLRLAMDWLRAHSTELDAGFTLPTLLGWSSERLGKEESELLKLAMDWLRSHSTEFDAGFTLPPLLGWSSKRLGKEEGDLLRLTMGWLQAHPTELDAQFVLYPLLDKWPQGRLGKEEGEVLRLAMGWLRAHPTELDARFVLHPLLDKWPQERLGKEEREVLRMAMDWLRAHPTELDAQFVLHPLLDRWPQERLGKEEGDLLKLTMYWLELFGSTPKADFVLNGLLLEPALMPDDRHKWSSRALELASEGRVQGDETHLLKTLLQLAARYWGEVPANEIVIFAEGWLDRHPVHPERTMALARLLRIRKLPEDAWRKAARAALDCLESQDSGQSDDYALNGLMTRVKFLGKVEREQWLMLSCRWMEKWGNQRDCDSLLSNYLKSFRGGVPDDVKAALDAAYSRRFPGKAFDWNRPIEWR